MNASPWRGRSPRPSDLDLVHSRFEVAAGKDPAIRPLVNGALDPRQTPDQVMSLPTALPQLGGTI